MGKTIRIWWFMLLHILTVSQGSPNLIFAYTGFCKHKMALCTRLCKTYMCIK